MWKPCKKSAHQSASWRFPTSNSLKRPLGLARLYQPERIRSGQFSWQEHVSTLCCYGEFGFWFHLNLILQSFRQRRIGASMAQAGIRP
jgi:hypothetical protein